MNNLPSKVIFFLINHLFRALFLLMIPTRTTVAHSMIFLSFLSQADVASTWVRLKN